MGDWPATAVSIVETVTNVVIESISAAAMGRGNALSISCDVAPSASRLTGSFGTARLASSVPMLVYRSRTVDLPQRGDINMATPSLRHKMERKPLTRRASQGSLKPAKNEQGITVLHAGSARSGYLSLSMV
jgi:hypothetical protein